MEPEGLIPELAAHVNNNAMSIEIPQPSATVSMLNAQPQETLVAVNVLDSQKEPTITTAGVSIQSSSEITESILEYAEAIPTVGT